MFSRIERSERRVNFGLFRLRGIVLSVMSVVAMVEVIRPLVTVSQIGSHPPHPQRSYKYLDFWYVDFYLYSIELEQSLILIHMLMIATQVFVHAL